MDVHVVGGEDCSWIADHLAKQSTGQDNTCLGLRQGMIHIKKGNKERQSKLYSFAVFLKRGQNQKQSSEISCTLMG